MNNPQSAPHGEGDALETGQSDPDLSKKAAQKIFCWQVVSIAWASEQRVPVWHTAEGDPVMSEFSWRPDRDEAQNMQVLDRMLELGYDFELSVKPDRTLAVVGLNGERLGRSQGSDRKIVVLEAALQAIRNRPKSDP